MKKIRTIAILLIIALLLATTASCSNNQFEWKDSYCKITYDEDNFPIIAIDENIRYPKSTFSKTQYYTDGGYVATITYDEYIAERIKFQRHDDFCLVKIIQKLTTEEMKQIEKEIDSTYSTIDPMGFSLYRVIIVYDYLKDCEVNEEIYMYITGEDIIMIDGQPPLDSGDTFVAFLTRKHANPTMMTMVVGFSLGIIKDNVINYNTMVYRSARGVYIDLSVISVPLEENERYMDSPYEDNPRRINQKFRLGELIDFIKKDLEERGYDYKS